MNKLLEVAIIVAVLFAFLGLAKLALGQTTAPTRILSSEHTRQMDQINNLGKFLEVRLNEINTLEHQTQNAITKAMNNLSPKSVINTLTINLDQAINSTIHDCQSQSQSTNKYVVLCDKIMITLDKQCQVAYFGFCFGPDWSNFKKQGHVTN